MGKTSVGERSKSIAKTKFGKPKDPCYRKTLKKLKKIYKKIAQTQKIVKCADILKTLDCFPNFIGCFAQDQLLELEFHDFPCTFLVNLDSYKDSGSHWIAIGIFEKIIEIFDPLGFKFYNWPNVPCQLLQFLHDQSKHKKLIFSSQLQSLTSTLCTVFCMFYIIKRSVTSLDQIEALFTAKFSDNDSLLYSLLCD